jgi:hypothetical protein
MPVTRSVTHAAKQRSEVNEVKNTIPKTNAKDSYPSKSGKSQKLPQHHSLLEWISLKDSPNDVVPNSDQLFSTLQEMHQLKGCKAIARGRPRELSDIEWLMIGKKSESPDTRNLDVVLFPRCLTDS